MIRRFRQSELKKFKRCPRSWWLSYQRGGAGYEFARKPDSEPQSGQRDTGTLVHSGLEYKYKGLGNPALFLDSIAAHENEVNGPLSDKWLKVYRLARTMVDGYEQWVESTGADQGEETVAVELELQLPIGKVMGDDVILTCKIDHVYRDLLSGELVIRDHKTVQSLDNQEILSVDDQGQFYCMMASQHFGERVNRFEHNMLRKVLRTATANPPFYGRQGVRFNEQQLDNAWTQQYSVINQMVSALQAVEADEVVNHHKVMYPTPNPQLCDWDCDFLHICPMMNNGDDWAGALSGSGIYTPRPLTLTEYE